MFSRGLLARLIYLLFHLSQCILIIFIRITWQKWHPYRKAHHQTSILTWERESRKVLDNYRLQVIDTLNLVGIISFEHSEEPSSFEKLLWTLQLVECSLDCHISKGAPNILQQRQQQEKKQSCWIADCYGNIKLV